MISKKINRVVSTIVPLQIENVDTDQIIPSRFLKSTNKEGFGNKLFYDWRYTGDLRKSDFVLNNSNCKGRILVVGKNFGCGSSREHAVWAIKDYGFDVIVSSSFADIFSCNALNNFLLPVQVTEAFLQRVFVLSDENVKLELDVNLLAQTITIPETAEVVHFDIDPYKKDCLLRGFDDIDYLLSMKHLIEKFEGEI